MRIETVVKLLKERQAAMRESVFNKDGFDEVAFAKTQGRYLGLGDALTIISDEMRKEGNED
jgi:hypothetical protein